MAASAATRHRRPDPDAAADRRASSPSIAVLGVGRRPRRRWRRRDERRRPTRRRRTRIRPRVGRRRARCPQFSREIQGGDVDDPAVGATGRRSSPASTTTATRSPSIRRPTGRRWSSCSPTGARTATPRSRCSTSGATPGRSPTASNIVGVSTGVVAGRARTTRPTSGSSRRTGSGRCSPTTRPPDDELATAGDGRLRRDVVPDVGVHRRRRLGPPAPVRVRSRSTSSPRSPTTSSPATPARRDRRRVRRRARSASASTSRSGRPSACAAAAASSCSTLTRPAASLTRDRGGRRRRRRLVALLRPALDRRRPHAEAAGLGEQHARRRARRAAGSHEGRDGVGRPALLHHDRRRPGVVGAGGEERGDRVGEHLAGDVVDVDLELHGRAGPGAASTASPSAPSPTITCTTLGRPAVSARAGAVADRRRPSSPAARPNDVGQGGEGGDAGRRRQLQVGVDADRPARCATASRRATAGAGLGRLAVGGGDRAVADGDRAGDELRRCPALERGGDADDVDDRVEAPTSWNSTSSGSMPWTAPSAAASASNTRLGSSPDAVGEVGGVEQLADLAAPGGARGDRGGRRRRRWPTSPRRRSAGPARTSARSRRRRAPPSVGEHAPAVGAGVDERAEQHVAGDAGAAVERRRRAGHGHGAASGRRRRPRRSRCRCRRRSRRWRTRRASPAAP